MARFTEQTTIDAPRTRVWEALADIGSISEWNPGVAASHQTSEGDVGLGASRHCDLTNRMKLEEEVVEFEPQERLTMRIVGGTAPFAHADIHFTLKDEGEQTLVEVAPDYAMKFGPVGKVLDRLVGERSQRKGMRALLRGLKDHVEAQAGD